MHIQIVSISKPDWKEKGKAKWQELTMTYVSGGKTSAKKFLSFDPIFNKVKEFEADEQYDVNLVKGDDGYWKWTEVTKVDSAAGAAQGVGEAARAAPMVRASTYETPEERAKKQVYIVRQSSISNAIEYLNHNQKNYAIVDVVNTAKEIEAYVFGMKFGTDALIDMADDIPE